IISSIDYENLKNWFVWKEDWSEWKCVEEVEGLTEKVFRAVQLAPPPLPVATSPDQPFANMATGSGALMAPLINDSHEIKVQNKKVAAMPEQSIKKMIDNAYFPQQDDSGSFAVTPGEFIARAKKRFPVRLVVTVLGDESRQFVTHTKDVSVGGLHLEEDLPEWVKGYFKVRISKPNSKQQIELTCCLLSKDKSKDRKRAAFLPLQSLNDEKNLELWFAA
ncbi:MAG: PilZ domain-containing protein, partial [Bdellovibrionales bacterium]